MEERKSKMSKKVLISIIVSLLVIIGGIALISELVYQKHRANELEVASKELSSIETLRENLETPVVIGQEKPIKRSTNSGEKETGNLEGLPKAEQAQETKVEEVKDGATTEPKSNQLNPALEGEQQGQQPQVAVKNGRKVAIDPGHQGQGNSEHEPIGPGATETKPKVASGTHGKTSGLDEYELNLTVSLKLRDELVKRGYEVYMIRESHEVNISNRERAELAAQAGADILVRIHANGATDTSMKGALTMAPKGDNPYLSRDLITKSNNLSQEIITGFCEATGAKNLGVQGYNNMSGINWTQIPVSIVEMGFMSNPDEDVQMAQEGYQEKMVQGMANGIDSYYKLP